MKQPSKPPRTPSRLSDSVHHQLNAYALAASAAGVGLLALSQPADAKIIYTKTHRVIAPGQHYGLDLNHKKVADFTFWNTTGATTLPFAQYLRIRAPRSNSNRPVGYLGAGRYYASALNKGSLIGPDRQFLLARTATMVGVAPSAPGGWGPWYNVKDRYLGLRFSIEGATHYGWARLSATGKYPTMAATLTGYAYETIPNKPIITGKTKGPDVITVQSDAHGSLGHLARGASGNSAAQAEERK